MITLSEGLAMADWQILLGVGIIFFIVAAISFISHLRTPKEKRSKGINQPFIFIIIISIGGLLISILFFVLNK
jgi:hypothetical protein